MIDVDTGNDMAALVVENLPDLKAIDISSAYFWYYFLYHQHPLLPCKTFFNSPFTTRFRKLNQINRPRC